MKPLLQGRGRGQGVPLGARAVVGRPRMKAVLISVELSATVSQIRYQIELSPLNSTHPVAIRGDEFSDLSLFSSSPPLRLFCFFFDWRSIGGDGGDDIGARAGDHDRERHRLDHALLCTPTVRLDGRRQRPVLILNGSEISRES